MWNRIKTFFKHSETIFLARFQIFVGALAVFITYVQPEVFAPITPTSWTPWIIVIHGFAIEYLRRRRDERL